MQAETVANYLVYLMSDSCEDLTNMKLNKLLYFAQGHYLQEYGEPMFSDKIEAWEHGPVVPAVYAKYKYLGNSVITGYDTALVESVPEDVAEVLFEVARKYGRYTASALRNMTHAVNTPWDKVYRPDVSDIEIPTDFIRDFFSGLEALKPLECTFADSDFVGRRDEAGNLVLPKGWDDESV